MSVSCRKLCSTTDKAPQVKGLKTGIYLSHAYYFLKCYQWQLIVGFGLVAQDYQELDLFDSFGPSLIVTRCQLSSESMVSFQARRRRKGVERQAKDEGQQSLTVHCQGALLDLSHPMTSTDILVARSVSHGKRIWEIWGEALLLSFLFVIIVCFFFFQLGNLPHPPPANCCFINKEEGRKGCLVGN